MTMSASRPFVLPFLGAFVTAAILSACGGGDAADTSSNTPDPATTPAPVQTPTPSATTCAAAAAGSTGYSLVFKHCNTAGVAEYYEASQCVRDNATGLIWQGQTPAGTGIRANDQYKTNFDSTTSLQKWKGTKSGPSNTVIASDYRAPTQAEIDAPSNATGFKNIVNATTLCGFSDWRLPSKTELLSITKATGSPKIDNTWFPNTASWIYTTTSPSNLNEHSVWIISFADGNAHDIGAREAVISYPTLVRLVR